MTMRRKTLKPNVMVQPKTKKEPINQRACRPTADADTIQPSVSHIDILHH